MSLRSLEAVEAPGETSCPPAVHATPRSAPGWPGRGNSSCSSADPIGRKIVGGACDRGGARGAETSAWRLARRSGRAAPENRVTGAGRRVGMAFMGSWVIRRLAPALRRSRALSSAFAGSRSVADCRAPGLCSGSVGRPSDEGLPGLRRIRKLSIISGT